MPHLTLTEISTATTLSPSLVASYDISQKMESVYSVTQYTHTFTYLLTFSRPTQGIQRGSCPIFNVLQVHFKTIRSHGY